MYFIVLSFILFHGLSSLVGVLYGWDKIKAALLKYEELNGDFFVPWKYVIPVHAETSGWPQGEKLTVRT